MKDKTALGHLICVITSDCHQDENTEHTTEIREEETIAETIEATSESGQGFGFFDLDSVFAN